MKIVGITGGIGSGKTLASNWFLEQGVPVYNSDIRARNLMDNEPVIKKKILAIFGENVYKNERLNRSYIAEKVFQNKELLKNLNQIVHPFVFQDFKNWVNNQDANFVLKEAAILFESGSYKDCDVIISVIADPEIRIKRVIERDNLNREQIMKRMDNQWTDEKRIENSDYILMNESTKEEFHNQCKQLYNILLKRFQTS